MHRRTSMSSEGRAEDRRALVVSSWQFSLPSSVNIGECRKSATPGKRRVDSPVIQRVFRLRSHQALLRGDGIELPLHAGAGG